MKTFPSFRQYLWLFLLITWTLIPVASSNGLKAAPLDPAEAMRIASGFLGRAVSGSVTGTAQVATVPSNQTGNVQINRSPSSLSTTAQPVVLLAKDAKPDPAFYIFGRTEGSGFVVVSGEQGVGPILGYSDDTSFPAENWPDNVRSILQAFSNQIQQIRNSSLPAAPGATESLTGVKPLLGAIRWDQNAPYNILCPWDATSSSRTVAGCVATMMGQVMKYHRWPVKGTGSFSYSDKTYGTLSANFGTTTYPWDNMLDSYLNGSTKAQDSAAALLSYHCGVAVQMSFSPTGSSASFYNAGKALTTYFGYDTDLQHAYRNFYSDAAWKSLIRKELDAGRPVPYSAMTVNQEGHAFLCDGYDAQGFFHINWGWSGSCNGYFDLGFLSPELPGIGGAASEYTFNQFILTGLGKPDGIKRQTWELYLYNKGLTSDKSYWAVTRTNGTCALSYSFCNYGLNDYSGEYGVGYLYNGSWVKLVSSGFNISLPSMNASSEVSFSSVNISGLSLGTYSLGALWKHKDSTNWSLIKGSPAYNNTLILTKTKTGSSTYARISLPDRRPRLELADTLLPVSGCYANRKASFQVKVLNTGQEFNSFAGIQLVSKSNPLVKMLFGVRKAVCPAAQTTELAFSDTIQVPEGTYSVALVYDTTNNDSPNNLLQATSLVAQTPDITVKTATGAADLQLTRKITLTPSTTFARNQEITLTAQIRNQGGFFDSRVYGFLYPPQGGGSVASIGPVPLYLDALGEKTVQISGTFDVPAGDYKLFVLQEPNYFQVIAPQDSALLWVHLTDSGQTGLQKRNAGSAPWYIQGDQLQFETDTIERIQLFDLSGRLMREVGASSLSVGGLDKGIYLVRLYTRKGTFNQKIRIG